MTNESANDAQKETDEKQQNSPGTGEAPTGTTSSDAERESRNIRTPDAWRYPDDYRVTWMRGKTADEVAVLSDQMYQDMIKPQNQQQQHEQFGTPQQNWQQPPQQQQQPQFQMPTDDDFLSSPANATQRYVDALKTQQLDPVVNSLYQQQAELALYNVQRDEKESFDRWGPEIMQNLRQIDPRLWNPSNIRKVVSMVRGEHADDLVKDRLEKEIQRRLDSGTLRPDGATMTSSPTPASGVDFNRYVAELPPRYSAYLERARMTPQVFEEFLQKTECEPRGIPLKQAADEWFENAKKGDILLAGDE